MTLSWTMGLLLAATATNGIAAGATLDQAIKQLPARRRIGAHAYLNYARAADMSNGLIWYPIMGVGTAVLTVAAVIVGLLAHPARIETTIALAAAAAGTVAHTAATSRAAPTLLTLRRGEPPAATVETVLDRFATINGTRAAAIVTTLAATAWALARRTARRVAEWSRAGRRPARRTRRGTPADPFRRAPGTGP